MRIGRGRSRPVAQPPVPTIRRPARPRRLPSRPHLAVLVALLLTPVVGLGLVPGASDPDVRGGGPQIERAEPRAPRVPRPRFEPDWRAGTTSTRGRAVAGDDTELAAGPVTEVAASAPGAPVPAAAAPTTAPPAPGPDVNLPPPRPDRAAPADPGAPPPAVSEGSNAVFEDDFPDPYVLRAGGSWYAFSTQVGPAAVPTMRSDDLVEWEPVGDALQGTPQWAEWGPHWAPSVIQVGSRYVLYYSVPERATGLQCISRAVSALPQGPYVDRSTEPMICQRERGGSIDPSPFVDADGRRYLLWKSEGTRQGEPTRLWAQALSDDGMWVLGPRAELLQQALPWERPIIEGPTMVLQDGRYHLLYSGNRWESPDYAVGHAVCDSVLGPCRRTSDGPTLRTRPGAAGPGGQEVFRLPDGGLGLAFHAWDPEAIGYPRGARMLHISKVHVEGDRLVVGRPVGAAAPSGLLGFGR